MKPYRIAFSLLIGLTLSVSQVWAVSLTLSPTNQTILPASLASVDVIISGLGNGAPPSLGEFDIELQFDPGILSFNAVSFGSSLGTQDTNFTPFNTDSSETDIAVTTTANSISLFEHSFLGAAALNGLQADSFTLAILEFTGLVAGTSSLDFVNVSLLNALGDDIIANSQNSTITVSSNNVVPEPSTILLIGTGLICLATWRWHVQRRFPNNSSLFPNRR